MSSPGNGLRSDRFTELLEDDGGDSQGDAEKQRTPTFTLHIPTPGGAVDRLRGRARMSHDRIGLDKAPYS